MGTLGHVLWDMGKFDLAEKYYLHVFSTKIHQIIFCCVMCIIIWLVSLPIMVPQMGGSHYNTKAMEVDRKIKTVESELY